MKHDSAFFKWVMSQKLQRFKFSSVIIPTGFQRLHRIVRWNAIVPAGLERSVLEHSTAMAQMAIEMGLSEDAALKAILHDALEVYSGDIQAVFKMIIPGYENVEKNFFKDHKDTIKKDFFNVADELYIEHWKGEEGRFLKFLDHLDGWLEVEDMMNHGVWCPEFERYRAFLIKKYFWVKERFLSTCSTCSHLHVWSESKPYGSTEAPEYLAECGLEGTESVEDCGESCPHWQPRNIKE